MAGSDSAQDDQEPLPMNDPAFRSKTRAKKPYRSPRLIVFGDVRDWTLGPSVGIGESGNPLVFRA